MSSFDLELRITGICAFIPNADRTPGAYTMCVVMPGVDGAKFALDGELLCPHTSWIEALADSSFQLSRQSLRGVRVTFAVTPEKPTGYPTVAFPPTSGYSQPADLKKVCGDYIKNLDTAIVSFPPRADIATQVLLREGQLDYSSQGATWNIGYLSNGTPTENQNLTHEMVITLPDLTAARLVLEPFPSGIPTSIPLMPITTAKPIRLQLVNDCKYDQPPPSKGKALKDRDFKWYYELMTEATRKYIQEEIGSKDLPFPLLSPAFHKIGGQNCFPARAMPIKF